MAIRYFDTSKQRAPVAAQADIDLVGATRWLTGQERQIVERGDKGSPGSRGFITPEKAAELTKSYLGLVGSMARNYFDAGMPPSYALPRIGIETALLDNLPHLGYCNFAAVKMRKGDGSHYVVKFFYANFKAKIDTTPGADFFKLETPERSQMFFGIAFSPDGKGEKTLSVDRSIHHAGVSFIAYEPSKALDTAIAMRTGVTAEDWRKMAAQRQRAASRSAA